MKDYYKRVINYCNKIKTKKIKSGVYTQKAIKRFLDDIKKQKDEGFLFTFDKQQFKELCEFAESLLLPETNKHLELLDWQLFIYANLYGWKYKDNTERRRFRQAYIEVARKNGKTTGLLFPLIIYDFLTTNSQESYLVSKDGNLAEKCFSELKGIINNNKDLKEICKCLTSVVVYDTSRITFFSSESSSIDGYKNSLSIIDEFHSYPDDKIVTAFRYGQRQRLNGLVQIITSAGLDTSSQCYTENKKCKSILNDTLTDDSYFGIIYQYDEKDDWQDEKNFIKANPSLGQILDKDILLSDLKDAMITPSHQADFKSKTCGFWSNEVSNWIPIEKWKQPKKDIDFDIFKNIPCFGGLDLSSVGDFTAYTLCWFYKKKYYFKHKFYLPSNTVIEKFQNTNIPKWIDEKYITVIQGNTIDYSYVVKDILFDAEKYNILEIAFDRWQSKDLIKELDEKLPKIDYIDYDQSLKKFSQPTKFYEKNVLENKIIDKNPVLFWMLQNVVIKPTVNNDYKPLKEYKSSTKKIDGVITSIMTLDRCKQFNETDQKKVETNFDDVLKFF